MPRKATKRVRSAARPMQYFNFEIQTWEPEYRLSVNQSRFERGPYWEHINLEIKASCLLSKKLVGRTATFGIFGRRDQLEISQSDPSWRPRCVGELELRPTYGRFYSAVPHDSIAYMLTGFAHGLFHFILLWGPALRYGKSLCTSFDLKQAVNLEDYGDC